MNRVVKYLDNTGLPATRGQVVVPIDVDLQDPPGFVSHMVASWREE
jgi:glycosyltransferase involved in cell wall biosynthesis